MEQKFPYYLPLDYFLIEVWLPSVAILQLSKIIGGIHYEEK